MIRETTAAARVTEAHDAYGSDFVLRTLEARMAAYARECAQGGDLIGARWGEQAEVACRGFVQVLRGISGRDARRPLSTLFQDVADELRAMEAN